MLVHFCPLGWGAPYERAATRVTFLSFCNEVKPTGWQLTPLPGQGWSRCLFLPAASQGIADWRAWAWIAAAGLAQLPPHTSPNYRWSLQPAQPRLASGAWTGEAAGLLSKCIYYSLDCKNGQTNFPNLRRQTHPQSHSPKPEKTGGIRRKNTTGFSVNVGTTLCTAKRQLTCTAGRLQSRYCNSYLSLVN